MNYPSYLVHFNQNHSKKNGQFTSGDGDGDGTRDERSRHGRYKPEAIGNHNYNTSIDPNDPQQMTQKLAIKQTIKLAVKGLSTLAGKAFCKKVFGTRGKDNIKSFKKQKSNFTDKIYDKAATKVNNKLNQYMGG